MPATNTNTVARTATTTAVARDLTSWDINEIGPDDQIRGLDHAGSTWVADWRTETGGDVLEPSDEDAPDSELISLDEAVARCAAGEVVYILDEGAGVWWSSRVAASRDDLERIED